MIVRHTVLFKLAPTAMVALCIVTGAWAQTATPPEATPPSASSAQSGENKPKQLSDRERAAEELKQQEKQRILGVIPNFNTTNVQNAAPLSPGQKFQLMFKSAADPFQFVASGLSAGLNQAEDNFAGYGQGAQGYAKRFGAAYADQFDGLLWGNAILPILLHEDPRYFRKGSGSFKKRFFYAISTTVITKNDNGTRGPNYANVLGNFVSGGISNAYYPASDRGLGLTVQNALTVTAEGAIGAIFVEFWPDISRHLFHRHQAQTGVTEPASE
ncbi:MAG: hypothetical protein ABSD96_16195 [Candidatus Korobacteraceae bacterium]